MGREVVVGFLFGMEGRVRCDVEAGAVRSDGSERGRARGAMK